MHHVPKPNSVIYVYLFALYMYVQSQTKINKHGKPIAEFYGAIQRLQCSNSQLFFMYLGPNIVMFPKQFKGMLCFFRKFSITFGIVLLYLVI